MKTPVDFLSLLIRGASLLLWMLVIFFFSSLPGSEYAFNPTLSYYLERKGAHVIEYAILMFLAVRFVSILFPRLSFKYTLLLAGTFSILYGMSDEWHQSFVPYRGAKASDVAIDGLGILLSASVLLFVWYLHQKKKNR